MNQNPTTPRPVDADRPQRFDGIVGNQTVTKRVTAMLAKNRLPNLIFLTGPTGSGKTTTARIVARAKLCKERPEGEFEPCGACSNCTKGVNDTNCNIVEYHEYDANAVNEETLDNFQLMFLRPWEVIFIDELQDLAPYILRRLRKMLEGATATIILTTSHPGEIEDAFRNRLKSYEYEMTRPTVEEAANFLETQFLRHQISFGSRQQLERVAEALNCEMRPLGEFPRKVMAEADGKVTDEYLDELFGALAVQRTTTGGRRKQLI
jgi:DNA polymerase III gamma/tau subunit